MGLKEKVAKALNRLFSPQQLRLEDDEGISGFVVSDQFRGVPALERQRLIDAALRDTAFKLTKDDQGKSSR